MILKREGVASLHCDECGRRYPKLFDIRHLRDMSAASRSEGWRAFWGFPTSKSPDWPRGKAKWRHACPACVIAFAERKRAEAGRLF